VTFRRASAASFWRLVGRPHPEGGGVVACAAAMPLVVLALAVATDYASVSRFRTRVQLAAEAASVAAAEAIARQPDRAGGVDDFASQVAAAVFTRRAPRGAAGTPAVAVKSQAAAVTATVGYAGLAPSNFGSALGYDAVTAEASATSLMRVADSRSAAAR
jgi:Flp pilus assembly protein TadG